MTLSNYTWPHPGPSESPESSFISYLLPLVSLSAEILFTLSKYKGRDPYVKVRGAGAGGYEVYISGAVWSNTVFALFVGNNELSQFMYRVCRVEGCTHVGFYYMFLIGR